MRCPECEAPLDAAFGCANGHSWPQVDGVRRMINAELGRTLGPFLEAFGLYRRKNGGRIEDPAIYPGLPQSGLPLDRGLWQLRVLDLELVREMLGDRRALRVLDVGAWNGWLSQNLAKAGHQVVALDYFLDPFDGLGAVRHYPASFTAIQFDLERLDLLDDNFDLVIVNRCIAYFEDLERSIEQMKRLVAPGGTLLLTGLNVFERTRRIERHFARSRARFKKAHGLPYFFKRIKGYLSGNNLALLHQHEVRTKGYNGLAWRNLLHHLIPSRPLYYHGTWTRPVNES